MADPSEPWWPIVFGKGGGRIKIPGRIPIKVAYVSSHPTIRRVRITFDGTLFDAVKDIPHTELEAQEYRHGDLMVREATNSFVTVFTAKESDDLTLRSVLMDLAVTYYRNFDDGIVYG